MANIFKRALKYARKYIANENNYRDHFHTVLMCLTIKNYLSDERYLKRVFRDHTGYDLNLENPQTFNEKLQWLKLHDRKPEYTRMADKYEAKKYAAEIIGDEYIIPTLGIYDSFDEIDFDKLPEQFVLKCNHDCGSIIIVRDKSNFDRAYARKFLTKRLKRNYFWQGREWPYKNIKPRIIAEKYMKDSRTKDLVDYKFYCFNGEPKYLYVSQGLEDHATARISFLNLDWTFAPFNRTDYRPFDELPPKPEHFELMKDFATHLAGNTEFVRVDLYEINGHVYFSECTFFPCGGMMPFEPKGYDKILGDMLKIF